MMRMMNKNNSRVLQLHKEESNYAWLSAIYLQLAFFYWFLYNTIQPKLNQDNIIITIMHKHIGQSCIVVNEREMEEKRLNL